MPSHSIRLSDVLEAAAGVEELHDPHTRCAVVARGTEEVPIRARRPVSVSEPIDPGDDFGNGDQSLYAFEGHPQEPDPRASGEGGILRLRVAHVDAVPFHQR